MRLFRRQRDAKTTGAHRVADRMEHGAKHDARSETIEPRSAFASATQTQPSLPESLVVSNEPVSPNTEVVVDRPSTPSVAGFDDSDVFVCNAERKPEPEQERPLEIIGDKTELGNGPKTPHVAGEVMLFVHHWHNVEPGLLSWTFPSLRAALDSVQRMKNAIGWCVVSGTGWSDLESARAGGAVLVEQLS